MVNITKEEFQRIYDNIKKLNAKALFYFRGIKYVICMNKLIKSIDKNFNVVPWSISFGSKSPYEVLSSFHIEKIEVEIGGKESIVFNDLKEFTYWLYKHEH
ncbi:MAG: hypothetical protein QXI93_00635 [Candidatus Methanomethylicia archaeon]